MNSSVTVTGMTIKTQVGGNLLISATNAEASYSTDNLLQSVTGTLEPVSTTTGADFFYTKENVYGDGHTTDTSFETYANTTEGKSAFATYYGVEGAVGYVDYAFYLKATSSAANEDVKVTKVNLVYGNPAASLGAEDRAWRAAIFAQPVAKDDDETVSDGTLKTILGPQNAAYFEGKAASSATTLVALPANTFGQSAIIGTITTKGATQRYRVVVRVYLEGNDTSCNNDTYAVLTNDYALSLKCELAGNNNAAQIIQSSTTAL